MKIVDKKRNPHLDITYKDLGPPNLPHAWGNEGEDIQEGLERC